jgi:LacI family transcriptional regulator
MVIERVTIRTVAERAGVSTATVSLVLNDRPGVRIGAEARARVLAAARDLGYAPNRIARSLAHGRTALLGVIVPDLSNAFYADIVGGIEASAGGLGLRVLLAHSHDEPEREREQARLLAEQQVDGLICMVADRTAPLCRDWLPSVQAQGLACVIVDELDPGVAVDCIASDDHAGATLAAEQVVARGCRRVALLSAGEARSSARERLAGWRAGLAAGGIEVTADLIAGGSYRTDAAAHAVAQLLAARPQAILAANDHLAAMIIDHAGRLGLRIPEDLALIGYANDRHLAPALGLTTIDQDAAGIGAKAVSLLMRRIAEPGATWLAEHVAPKLVIRRTA